MQCGINFPCIYIGVDLTTVYSSRKTGDDLTTRKKEPDANTYLILISGLSVVTIIILIVIIIAMVVALKRYLITSNHLH